MPVIIQEAQVQVAPPPDPRSGVVPEDAAREAQAAQAHAPLRPADVERLQLYLDARRARIHAD
ncbi:MAG: hypothetical protein IPH95_20740 [Candidatus Promineofilum sp.]|jgi:hypothetical protein|nr:hypothetical protein [Promineifilum sp.]